MEKRYAKVCHNYTCALPIDHQIPTGKYENIYSVLETAVASVVVLIAVVVAVTDVVTAE